MIDGVKAKILNKKHILTRILKFNSMRYSLVLKHCIDLIQIIKNDNAVDLSCGKLNWVAC